METLPQVLHHVLNSFRNSYALNWRKRGQWKQISTEFFLERIRRLSLGLRDLGVKKGDSVGLLAQSSPFWLIADFAICSCGARSVPIFPHSALATFKHIQELSNFKVIIISDDAIFDPYKEMASVFDEIVAFFPSENSPYVDFHDVMERGDTLSKKSPMLYQEMVGAVKSDDVATIIFTSGSTGVPKGVELTHGNFCHQLWACAQCFPLDPNKDRILSVLPLAHVFERTLIYYYVSCGVSIYFADDVRKTAQLCQDVRPTISAMVPRLIEKVYSRIISKADTKPLVQRLVAKWAIALAHKKGRKWQKAIADRLVYKQLREALGGNIRGIIIGGAALDPELGAFFGEVGINLFQGYGLTESSPVIATNFEGHNKIGTVGPAFPGVEIKISDEGEILARGANIMRGYYKNPEATAQAIDTEGFLHTGDRGTLDEDGYLTITGRIRELYKTSNGKYVAPVPIEQGLSKPSYIALAMVVAEKRKFVSVLLFPDFDELQTLKKDWGCAQMTDEEFLESAMIQQEITGLVAEINSRVNHWEQVRKWRFVISPISIKGGELTPTLKLRRDFIAQKYAHIIDNMYQEEPEESGSLQ